MAKSFRELEARMSPAALARSDAEAAKLAGEMVLNELRQAGQRRRKNWRGG